MPIDFQQARFAMVEQQVRPWDVLDPRVLDTLMTVRREDFVPARHRKLAFADLPLPLEHGEVMMKPVLEGRLKMSAEGQSHDMTAGQILVLAPGVEHDVFAEEPTRMLLTVCLDVSKD